MGSTPARRTAGARHDAVSRLRRLARRADARRAEARLVIDGPVLLEVALEASWPVEVVLLAADAPPVATEVADRAEAAGAAVLVVAPEVLARAAATVTPNALAAIAAHPAVPLDVALDGARAAGFALVLVGVADPGNAGTLLRAGEAAGAGAVLFCGGAVDPGNPKCVRASAGALFHVPIAVAGEAHDVLEQVAAAGLQRVGTTARGDLTHPAADLRGPTALVLGSEAHGLDGGLDADLDLAVRIPMVGRAESLNVAMAGSVLAFEVLRQRAADQATGPADRTGGAAR